MSIENHVRTPSDAVVEASATSRKTSWSNCDGHSATLVPVPLSAERSHRSTIAFMVSTASSARAQWRASDRDIAVSLPACQGPGLGRSHTAEKGPRGVVHATLSRAGVQASETVVVERKQVVTAGLVRRSRLVQQGVPRRLPRGSCPRGRRRSPVPVCTAALSDQEALWMRVRPLRHSIFAGPRKSGCWETPGAGSTLPCAGV